MVIPQPTLGQNVSLLSLFVPSCSCVGEQSHQQRAPFWSLQIVRIFPGENDVRISGGCGVPGYGPAVRLLLDWLHHCRDKLRLSSWNLVPVGVCRFGETSCQKVHSVLFFVFCCNLWHKLLWIFEGNWRECWHPFLPRRQNSREY